MKRLMIVNYLQNIIIIVENQYMTKCHNMWKFCIKQRQNLHFHVILSISSIVNVEKQRLIIKKVWHSDCYVYAYISNQNKNI